MSVSTVEFILRNYLLRPIATMVLSIVIMCGVSIQVNANEIEISFEIRDEVEVQSFNVVGCSYLAPSANGQELTFKCPVSHVYQVEYMTKSAQELKTEFGNLQVRPDLYRGVPYVGALHYVGTYSNDKAESQQYYKDAPENLKPIILTDVPIETEATGAKTITVAALVEKPKAKLEEVVPSPEPELEPIVEVEPITPLVIAQVSDPAPSANKLPTIAISWDSSYGSVQINGSTNVDELQEADGLIQGRIILTETLGNLFILSSSRNSNCNKAFTVEQLKEAQEVFFDCSEFTVNTPFKLPIDGEQCLHTNNTEISCLVSNSKKSLAIKLKGWGDVEFPLTEGAEVFDLTLAQLSPEFPAKSVMIRMNAASANQCDPRQLELRLGAYCLNDLCGETTDNGLLVDDNGVLPNLAAIGWDNGQLPNKTRFILVDKSGDTTKVLGEGTVPMPIPVETVSALIRRHTGNSLVPLDIEMVGRVFKVGRNVKFFSDDVCKAPLAKKMLDLSNPGNKVPDVPKCSFYRIFDGKKARSSCTAITYNKTAERSTAVLEVSSCSAKRLVIYVAENETINGRSSKAIVSSLKKLANELRAKEECVPIDIVHTADEKRQTLLKAEDMRFAESGKDLSSVFDLRFVNSNSEILRDFEWIYRTWDKNLGGVIVIADGEKAKPTDMIDSPASMAWKIKDIYRRAINFSGQKNCKMFKDVLLFDECKQGRAASFDAVLSEYIGQGLKSLGDQ